MFIEEVTHLHWKLLHSKVQTQPGDQLTILEPAEPKILFKDNLQEHTEGAQQMLITLLRELAIVETHITVHRPEERVALLEQPEAALHIPEHVLKALRLVQEALITLVVLLPAPLQAPPLRQADLRQAALPVTQDIEDKLKQSER